MPFGYGLDRVALWPAKHLRRLKKNEFCAGARDVPPAQKTGSAIKSSRRETGHKRTTPVTTTARTRTFLVDDRLQGEETGWTPSSPTAETRTLLLSRDHVSFTHRLGGGAHLPWKCIRSATSSRWRE